MAREIYSLTNATRDTLTDNVKRMAAAWDKSMQFLYGILGGEKTDPAAPFFSMYEGYCRAGISTGHYDTELEFIRKRHEASQTREASAVSFKNKLRSHNETLEKWVECMEDGRLSQEEIRELEKLLIKERDAIDLNLQALKFQMERSQKPFSVA